MAKSFPKLSTKTESTRYLENTKKAKFYTHTHTYTYMYISIVKTAGTKEKEKLLKIAKE